MSSRERLDMDDAEKAKSAGNGLSFRQRKGCFLERWALGLMVAIAVCAVVAVGLLVGFLGPCPRDDVQATPYVASEQKSKAKPYVMLPRSVLPEHYSVELQPYLTPDNFTFDGKVKIHVYCTEPTYNITLHYNDIIVHRDSVTLERHGGGEVPRLVGVREDKEREFYILDLERQLETNQTYLVSMEFVGKLNDALAGFYRSSYNDSDNQRRWLATTQFQPTDARRAFPCFDEPAMKATFDITLVRWNNMSSLSNMPKWKEVPRGRHWTADVYNTTVRMSTYLLAFVVSDFVYKHSDEFRIWTRPDAIETSDYALDIGPKILKFYENYFNVTYPLPKTDMVAIPDFSAGAMENWGLITFRETALLYDPGVSSSNNKQRVATVVSHELAHQWFGNLVTPKWWDDLWLNEGFASYVEYLGVHSVHPDWAMDQQIVVEDLQDVMELDCLKSSHPISVPVGHPDEINEIFDRISYGKGASLLRMMNFFLGDSIFRKGLSNYLIDKAFGNAVQDDLWQHLTNVQTGKSNKINIKTVMDSWTLQTGFPVVTIIRDYDSNTATASQTRFLLDHTDGGNSSVHWEIPLSYTNQEKINWSPETKIWLRKTEGVLENLPSKDKWIIANLQEVGYYKVNYDVGNWKLLIQQLQMDHKKIHDVNRAQIMDDAMDLARAGLLDYHIALNATLYLNQEMEYLPWESALNSFSYINSMLSHSAIYGKWKRYVLQQLETLYKEFGWKEDGNETILRQYTRLNTLSWTCKYDYVPCVKMARQKFLAWKKDSNTFIHPNLRSIVYCTSIRHGDEDDWNFVWQQYVDAEVASERDKLMNALACARESWLLYRYLEWSLDSNSGIRRQDGSYVFRSVASNIYGREIAFNYLRDKWDAVFEKYGKSFFAMSSLVKAVAQSLNTPFEYKQATEFFEAKKDNLGTAQRAVQQSLEKVQSNVRWMKNNYPSIGNWLDSQY